MVGIVDLTVLRFNERKLIDLGIHFDRKLLNPAVKEANRTLNVQVSSTERQEQFKTGSRAFNRL